MKAVRNILASLFSFIFFFVLLGMTLLLFSRNIFEADYYTEVLQDVNFSEVKLNDLGIDSFDEELGSEASVNDVLVKSLGEFNISASDAEKIINNNKIKEIAGNLMSEAVIYLTNKEKLPQIELEDVKEVIKMEEVSQVLEVIPSDMDLEELVNEVNKMISDYLNQEANNE